MVEAEWIESLIHPRIPRVRRPLVSPRMDPPASR